MMSAPMPAIAAFYAGLIGVLLVVLALPIERRQCPLDGVGMNANCPREARIAAVADAHLQAAAQRRGDIWAFARLALV